MPFDEDKRRTSLDPSIRGSPSFGQRVTKHLGQMFPEAKARREKSIAAGREATRAFQAKRDAFLSPQKTQLQDQTQRSRAADGTGQSAIGASQPQTATTNSPSVKRPPSPYNQERLYDLTEQERGALLSERPEAPGLAGDRLGAYRQDGRSLANIRDLTPNRFRPETYSRDVATENTFSGNLYAQGAGDGGFGQRVENLRSQRSGPLYRGAAAETYDPGLRQYGNELAEKQRRREVAGIMEDLNPGGRYKFRLGLDKDVQDQRELAQRTSQERAELGSLDASRRRTADIESNKAQADILDTLSGSQKDAQKRDLDERKFAFDRAYKAEQIGQARNRLGFDVEKEQQSSQLASARFMRDLVNDQTALAGVVSRISENFNLPPQNVQALVEMATRSPEFAEKFVQGVLGQQVE